MTELTEQEISKKLEDMRIKAILDLHKWESTKGHGVIINPDGTMYDYSWFLGFNNKTNSFGMCTSLDKREKVINCEAVKEYLQEDLMVFDTEYETNIRSDGGCDIIIKINEKSKYSNNIELYEKIDRKIKDIFK